jgi:D-alanyl-D-alanine carboxypeptidase/D-alanyl-D-alanine-endopeptidase (penicillin-binding protein 4)
MQIFTKNIKMTRFILFVSILLPNSWLIGQNAIQLAIEQFRNDPALQNATLSFQVIEAGTNKQIASFNSSASIPTASTAKLFSTAAAMEILGAQHRPATRIYHTGSINNGILQGDIWIRGGGDVSLGSKYFNEPGKEDQFIQSWIDSLKKKGITRIEGGIFTDGSEFGYNGVPDGWQWSDIGNYYGAGPAGICVFDNMIRYYFKTGPTPGTSATLIDSWPQEAKTNFRNGIKGQNVSGDNSYIYGAPYSIDRYSTGSLPINSPRFEVKGSMPDPEQQLAFTLFQALNKSGITVNGQFSGFRISGKSNPPDYSTECKLLFVHLGNTVKEIADVTNLKSINLFAEGLVCLVGYKVSGKGTTEEGLKQINNYLSDKINLAGLILNDGSGLSRSNGISASHFCSLLNSIYNSTNFETFFSTLPVAGRTGTLSNLCKDDAGEARIYAKSGTMSKTKSYAGYVYSKSGKKLIFSITAINYSCSSSALTKKMEQVLNTMAVF